MFADATIVNNRNVMQLRIVVFEIVASLVMTHGKLCSANMIK